MLRPWADGVNKIVGGSYQKSVPVLFVVAVIAFVIMGWWLFSGKMTSDWFVMWWTVAASTAGNLLLFIGGVSYVAATTFPTINYSYLCAAYFMVLFFVVTSLCLFGRVVKERLFRG